jgi:hypothetical protein
MKRQDSLDNEEVLAIFRDYLAMRPPKPVVLSMLTVMSVEDAVSVVRIFSEFISPFPLRDSTVAEIKEFKRGTRVLGKDRRLSPLQKAEDSLRTHCVLLAMELFLCFRKDCLKVKSIQQKESVR